MECDDGSEGGGEWDDRRDKGSPKGRVGVVGRGEDVEIRQQQDEGGGDEDTPDTEPHWRE